MKWTGEIYLGAALLKVGFYTVIFFYYFNFLVQVLKSPGEILWTLERISGGENIICILWHL